MENSKFYYCGKHPAILKSLVYKIECGQNFMDGVVYSYAIRFYLFHEDKVVTWMFEDENARDCVYGKVLDASYR